jgi:TRAP-type uncharacterized transport system fused permease subunit
MKIGVVALRLTIVGFIVPFLFVLNPSLLLIENFDIADFTIGLLRIICITWALSAALAGFGVARLQPVWRGAYILAAALCLARGTEIDVIGFGLVIAILVGEVLRLRAQPRTA